MLSHLSIKMTEKYRTFRHQGRQAASESGLSVLEPNFTVSHRPRDTVFRQEDAWSWFLGAYNDAAECSFARIRGPSLGKIRSWRKTLSFLF